jgi:TetR/AcrR family transcriptional regulator, transcriptional repressor for nem operon
VGRPRSFEESVAVERAAEVFRARGYASTSVDHLVEATGVHRGSLYGVFGSKHGLFLRVLDALDAAHTAPDQRLDVILVGLLELAPADPRVRERVGRLLAAHAITTEHLGARLRARAGLDTEESS